MERDSVHSLILLEERLWIVEQKVDIGRYDFNFEHHFACRHPFQREGVVTAIARMGAASDYQARYASLLSEGIRLIHTPDEYEKTSQLPKWYPLLADITPRSIWFDRKPLLEEITAAFDWPIFVKGERQTNKHQRHLSILEGSDDFVRVMDSWNADPILWWQQVVCREYVPLRLVGAQSPSAIPRAFEFRSFWWKSQCVGIGPYWQDEHYSMTAAERDEAVAIAGEAARRLDVTFLVVDVAQTAELDRH